MDPARWYCSSNALILGQSQSLSVEGEEARAAILKVLGVELSRSPTYRKYR